MTKYEAQEIVDLINSRNQLSKNYSSEDILSHKENYVFIKENNKVITCAQTKKVQWYQTEISHVSIAENIEGKGYGSKILQLAEKMTLENSSKILQCTIRTNNTNSIRLFSNKGYKQINTFYYPKTGNWVYIFQKVMSINGNSQS